MILYVLFSLQLYFFAVLSAVNTYAFSSSPLLDPSYCSEYVLPQLSFNRKNARKTHIYPSFKQRFYCVFFLFTSTESMCMRVCTNTFFKMRRYFLTVFRESLPSLCRRKEEDRLIKSWKCVQAYGRVSYTMSYSDFTQDKKQAQL